MADFYKALPTILLHEGLLVNNPKDPGGITNYGISLQFLLSTGDLDNDGYLDGDVNHDGVIDANDIKAMDQEKAAHLYKLYFWDKFGYGKLEDDAIATKIFDLCINMGALPAHRILQRGIRAAVGLKLQEDGILGLRTFAAVNMCKPPILLTALKSEAAGHYRSIRLKNNNQSEFIDGWLNRAYSNMVEVKDGAS